MKDNFYNIDLFTMIQANTCNLKTISKRHVFFVPILYLHITSVECILKLQFYTDCKVCLHCSFPPTSKTTVISQTSEIHKCFTTFTAQVVFKKQVERQDPLDPVSHLCIEENNSMFYSLQFCERVKSAQWLTGDLQSVYHSSPTSLAFSASSTGAR